MKLIDIIRDANQSLLRNKVRSFLTILAIFIGSFAIISTTAIQAGVNSFIDNQVNSYGGNGYLAITAADSTYGMDVIQANVGVNQSKPKEYNPDKQNGFTPITAEQIGKLKKLDGIDADSVQIVHGIFVDYIQGRNADAKKYTLDVEALPHGEIHIDTTAGTRPDNNSKDYQITLPADYAEVLGFSDDNNAIGKEVTLGVVDAYTHQTTEFKAKVVGVVAPGVVTLGYAYTNTALANAIYAENTKYYPESQKNVIYAVTASYDYKKYSSAQIKDQLATIGLSGMTITDIVGQVKTFFDVIVSVFNIFGVIALIAAAIGIVNTLFMSVQERTREIGLDKALGMSSHKIFLSFSFEAILLGFWGSVLGIAMSMLAGNICNNIFHASGGFLEAFPTFHLVEYPIQNIVTIILIVMFIAFLAGTIPARKAAKKNPIDALRYE